VPAHPRCPGIPGIFGINLVPRQAVSLNGSELQVWFQSKFFLGNPEERRPYVMPAEIALNIFIGA
jgi:hypothetical protein